MDKYEDDIHNTTGERLAQMIDEAIMRINKVPHNYKDNEELTVEVLLEAKRRILLTSRLAFNYQHPEP